MSYDVYFVGSGVATTQQDSSISTISATLSATPGEFITQPQTFSSLTGTLTHSKTTTRRSLASTTTVYLPVQATFSAGTMSAYGILRARRVR